MTPELVTKYLRLDRAIGNVVEFVGIDRAQMNAETRKAMDAVIEELDAASSDLQQAIYNQCGMEKL